MSNKIALICIDIQKEYTTEGRPLKVLNSDEVVENVEKLLKFFREKRCLVVHVKHISSDASDETFAEGSKYTEFDERVEPVKSEKVILKNLPGAFLHTDLEKYLHEEGVGTVVICGLLSFMCCDTTAREAHARGFRVIFVSDATAAIAIDDVEAEEIQRVVCTVQNWMFAEVMKTNEVEKKLE